MSIREIRRPDWMRVVDGGRILSLHTCWPSFKSLEVCF